MFRGDTFGGSENKELFQKHYRPNTDVLDIGGFIGTVSLVLSEVVDDNCKVHVFEPQYYDCLVKNIQDNSLENTIVPHRCGLSNVSGFLRANPIDTDRQGNYGGQHLTTLHDRSLDEQLVPEGSNTVELKKLDDFGLTNIGLIKLDVEGFELLVLQGGAQTLKNSNYPPVFTEVWEAECWRRTKKEYYEKNKQSIIDFLSNLNYKIVWKKGCDHLFVHE